MVAPPGGTLTLEVPTPGTTVEAALDGGVMTPVPDRQLVTPPEGVHWLAVRSRSPLGIGSAVRWTLLVVDGTPPELELTVAPDPVEAGGHRWVPRGAAVHLTASDATAGVAETALFVDGVPVSGPDSTTLDDEGPVVITARAEDRVGNHSERRLELVVDGTPPAVRLETGQPAVRGDAGLVVAAATPFHLSAEDSGSGVASTFLELDGQTVAPDRLQEPWPAGEHTLSATAEDGVGNRTQPVELRFIVDTEPPSILCKARGAAEATIKGHRWFRTPLQVTCTVDDDLAGVASVVRRDADLWTTGATFVLSDRDTVTVRGTDRVGNTVERTFRWAVDNDPPEPILRSVEGQPVGPAVTLATGEALVPGAVDRDSGTATIAYRIGGGAWIPIAGPIRFRHAGRYDLELRACDALGNCTKRSWIIEVIRRESR